MAGCGTNPVKPDYCAGWSPIYVSRKDILTDETAKQIYAHDEHGKTIGCWDNK